MTDNIEKAATLLAGSVRNGHIVFADPGRALAFATLAVAEQAKIANLIAYWQLHTTRSATESLDGNGQIEVALLHSDTDVDELIREALGI